MCIEESFLLVSDLFTDLEHVWETTDIPLYGRKEIRAGAAHIIMSYLSCLPCFHSSTSDLSSWKKREKRRNKIKLCINKHNLSKVRLKEESFLHTNTLLASQSQNFLVWMSFSSKHAHETAFMYLCFLISVKQFQFRFRKY